jgi:hypothetical protein
MGGVTACKGGVSAYTTKAFDFFQKKGLKSDGMIYG